MRYEGLDVACNGKERELNMMEFKVRTDRLILEKGKLYKQKAKWGGYRMGFT